MYIFYVNEVRYRIFSIKNEVYSIYGSFIKAHKRIPLNYNLWGSIAVHLIKFIFYIFNFIARKEKKKTIVVSL